MVCAHQILFPLEWRYSVREDMRTILAFVVALAANSAYAQQCPECTLAEACIGAYSAAVAKIKSQTSKGVTDFQKGMREMNLGQKGDNLSQRGAIQMLENMKLEVRFEIEGLKECLGKIR